MANYNLPLLLRIWKVIRDNPLFFFYLYFQFAKKLRLYTYSQEKATVTGESNSN